MPTDMVWVIHLLTQWATWVFWVAALCLPVWVTMKCLVFADALFSSQMSCSHLWNWCKIFCLRGFSKASSLTSCIFLVTLWGSHGVDSSVHWSWVCSVSCFSITATEFWISMLKNTRLFQMWCKSLLGKAVLHLRSPASCTIRLLAEKVIHYSFG